MGRARPTLAAGQMRSAELAAGSWSSQVECQLSLLCFPFLPQTPASTYAHKIPAVSQVLRGHVQLNHKRHQGCVITSPLRPTAAWPHPSFHTRPSLHH